MEQIDTASLPQNLEAEQALLGAVLANNKAYEKVSEFLRPYHFADSIHAKIFEVISKLIQRGHVADVITLKNYFEQEGSLNEVGGHQYLIKLADSASPLTNVEYYAQFIYDKYLRRELINTGYEIVNDAMKEDLDTDATAQIETAFSNCLTRVKAKADSSTLPKRSRLPSDKSNRPIRKTAKYPAFPPALMLSTKKPAGSTIPTSLSLPDVRQWAKPLLLPISPIMWPNL